MFNFELTDWKTRLLVLLGVLGLWREGSRGPGPVSRLIAAVLLLFVASQLWANLGLGLPQLGGAQRSAIDPLISASVKQIINAAPRGRSLAILQLQGDQTTYVTESLRQQLEQFGLLSLHGRGLSVRVRAFFGYPPQAFATSDLATAQARNLQADLALYGAVDFRLTPGGNLPPTLDLRLLDLVTGQEILLAPPQTLSDRITATLEPFTTDPSMQPKRPLWRHLAERLSLWLLAALLLPVATVNFLIAVLRRENNVANALTAGAYTLASTIVCALLMGVTLSAWWFWGVLLIAMVASGLYHLAVMSWLVRVRG